MKKTAGLEKTKEGTQRCRMTNKISIRVRKGAKCEGGATWKTYYRQLAFMKTQLTQGLDCYSAN